MAEKRKARPKRRSTKPTNSKKTVVPAEAKGQMPLPSSFKLASQSLMIIKSYWRPLLGIVVVYLVLNVIFASGLSNLGAAVDNIKANLNNNAGDHPLATAISGFTSLVGSAGVAGSASASVLQGMLFVIESLVIIWALRHLLAGKKVTVKDAYYHSSYPLIPFLLVLFVIILQLLPLSFGSALLSAVLTSAFTNLSMAIWISWLFFFILAAWSFYMLSASVFAAYIVTLPEMHPREALRSAKTLVRNRRRQVVLKILFLPLFIILSMGVVIIPLILFASFLVLPVFYVLSMLTILFVHTYLYTLYRDLIA